MNVLNGWHFLYSIFLLHASGEKEVFETLVNDHFDVHVSNPTTSEFLAV